MARFSSFSKAFRGQGRRSRRQKEKLEKKKLFSCAFVYKGNIVFGYANSVCSIRHSGKREIYLG